MNEDVETSLQNILADKLKLALKSKGLISPIVSTADTTDTDWNSIDSLDKDTLLNLTNHAYFNLDGISGNTLNQKLQVNAEKFLELDSENIPTGNFIAMENHAFDFRNSKNVVAGVDHCFVLKNNSEPAAILESETNGLTMKVYTDQPAVQIYVGGKTSEELQNKNLVEYHTESGICFETQVFPDAPNHEDFPNAILRKGETYHQNTTFKFINS
jgi:aldose 1-epimerase